MVEKECNLRAGVFKVQTFGTTHKNGLAEIFMNREAQKDLGCQLPQPSVPGLYEALLSKELLDISTPVEIAPNYPGDSPFSMQWMAGLGKGSNYSLSVLSLGSHTAVSYTHLTLPTNREV